MQTTHCPCGSSLAFSDCCEPLLHGEKAATTAEQLMRSRYTAYATIDVDYLLRTTHPSTRKQHSARSIRQWAEETTWLKLEITAHTPTTVTFRAHYLDSERIPRIHSEHSTFRQEKDTWYFVEGEVAE